MLNFDVITIFPSMFDSPLKESILEKAVSKGLISVNIHDLRNYAQGKHKAVDDTPYGGGEGMVLKPEPLVAAIEDLKAGALECGLKEEKIRVIYMSPGGRLFDQKEARRLATMKDIVLICGRYEGIDERVREGFLDEEISIGDYVLTGGELAAMIVIDAVSRMVPGVVGNRKSVENESLFGGVLKHPQYTRPPVFRGEKVPEVLMSGNHSEIEKWRKEKSLSRTLSKRPDLLGKS